MLSIEQNRQLTQVSEATPMGDLLRRYWHPVAGVAEFDDRPAKAIRILGEDLVLYKDKGGSFAAVERQCPHRRADLLHGIIEEGGIRCNYHGWMFDLAGKCVAQPFEDVVRKGKEGRGRINATAYPVRALGGMVWVYMGPMPVPELPDWEPFSWENGFVQVVISHVPCNWFQCQENSIDPVHFEWMHENWGKRLRGSTDAYGPTHLQLQFDEFDHGFVYRRIKEGSDETDEMWTIGRVLLWPNGFFLGEHFEWRVPIDDENTLSVLWKYTRLPNDRAAYHQERIPTWEGPIQDAAGNWITTHVMNQDFLAWVGQGRSDRGIVLMRRRFFDEMAKVAAGGEAKGIIRDPAANKTLQLPMMNREEILAGLSTEAIKSDAAHRQRYSGFIFQAGQPERVREEFAAAIGFEPADFAGLATSRQSPVPSEQTASHRPDASKREFQ